MQDNGHIAFGISIKPNIQGLIVLLWIRAIFVIFFNETFIVLAAALAKSELQINEQNNKFLNGKSTFYEELNEFSDLTMAQFELEKEGAKLAQKREGRGLGAILPDKSKWYTSPELLELYANRADVPDSWDASSKGNYSLEPFKELLEK